MFAGYSLKPTKTVPLKETIATTLSYTKLFVTIKVNGNHYLMADISVPKYIINYYE
jgi:hypothetical protein